MPSSSKLAIQIPAFTFIRAILNTPYRMIYPFLSVIARGIGVDLTAMSLALTARSLVGALNPIVASVADRRGRKFGMLSGVSLFLLGAALIVVWPTFPALVASMILITLGKYTFDPAMQAYLGDRIPYERRGTILAVTEIGWSLAFIAGIPLMGFLIARHGWMAPFPLMVVLGFLIIIGLTWMLPKDVRPADGSPSMGANFRTVLTFAPALAGLCVGMFTSTANEVVNLLFGVWLEQSFGLKIAALGAASAIIGISELSGEGLVAALVDRLGKPRSVALGLGVNSLAALFLPVLGRTEVGALMGLFLFYISFEFAIVSSIPMMTEVLPGARATVMAFNVAFMAFGRAIGAPLATLLFRFGFPAVTTAAVLFNLLAYLALRRMQRGLASRGTLLPGTVGRPKVVGPPSV
jgi:MFS transporter, DHA1 family, inner membrane transport protein